MSNCSVYIDGEEYVNLDTIIPTKSFLPTTGLKVNATKIIDRIPLEYLQTFHLEHRETLRKLNLTTENIQLRLNIFKWLSFGSIYTTMIICIGVFSIWLFRGIILRISDVNKKEMVPPESREELSTIPEPRKPRLIPQQ